MISKKNIIAHRGFWKIASEKNSLVAFERAFSNGYGVETDIRDLMGGLVVEHDLPDESALPISAFSTALKSTDKQESWR